MLRRSRGQVLLRRGSTAVLVMLSGAAKEHRGASEVEDVVLGLFGAGDVVGLAHALGRPREGDVTALADTQALLLPSDEFQTLARARPEVARTWLQATTEQLGALRNQVLAFASTSAAERVVHRLIELAERFSVPLDGAVRIYPPLTQEELGSWAGVSRESTAKALHDLRRAGIVSTRRRSLTILDPEALRRLMPDAGTPPVPEPLTIDLTDG